MTNSAFVMMIFSMLMLWGGAGYCIRIAMKNSNRNNDE